MDKSASRRTLLMQKLSKSTRCCCDVRLILTIFPFCNATVGEKTREEKAVRVLCYVVSESLAVVVDCSRAAETLGRFLCWSVDSGR